MISNSAKIEFIYCFLFWRIFNFENVFFIHFINEKKGLTQPLWWWWWWKHIWIFKFQILIDNNLNANISMMIVVFFLLYAQTTQIPDNRIRICIKNKTKHDNMRHLKPIDQSKYIIIIFFFVLFLFSYPEIHN